MITSVLDIVSGYLLHSTNFSECLYTSLAGQTPCSDENGTCPSLSFPQDTCYCCYLYSNRTGCRSRLLFDRQIYFSGVRDCDEVEKVTKPLLFCVGCVSLVGAIVLVLSLHHFSPLRYTILENMKGKSRKISLDEGEIINSIRNVTLEKIKSTFRRWWKNFFHDKPQIREDWSEICVLSGNWTDNLALIDNNCTYIWH